MWEWLHTKFSNIIWIATYSLLRPFSFLGTKSYETNDIFFLDSPTILIANHKNPVDLFIFFSFVPWQTFVKLLPIRVYAADNFSNHNKFSRFLKSSKILYLVYFLFNTIKVPSHGTTEEKLQLVLKSLKKGESIFLFPEGRMMKSDDIGEIKQGIFVLAKENPQIPIFISHINYGKKSTFRKLVKVRLGHSFSFGKLADINKEKQNFLLLIKKKLDILMYKNL